MIYNLANTIDIGRRVRVFVNGNEVQRAVFADTITGRVRYIPSPARAKKNSDVVFTRVLRGIVTVQEVI